MLLLLEIVLVLIACGVAVHLVLRCYRHLKFVRLERKILKQIGNIQRQTERVERRLKWRARADTLDIYHFENN